MQNLLLICCMALSAVPTQQLNITQTTHNFGRRIYGGQIASWKQFPWHAALYTTYKLYYICGGVLISDRWILTAGHCLEGHHIVQVQLGSILKKFTNPYQLTVNVNESIMHEKYESPSNLNDIALLGLSEKVTFSDYVKTISLPSSPLDFGTKTTLTGFGRLNDTAGDSSQILRYAHLIVVGSEVCAAYKNIFEGEKCAMGDGKIQSSCVGDSGGPLIANVDNSTVLVGIVSRGAVYSCEKGDPEIFTDIYYYRNWIKSKIDNA